MGNDPSRDHHWWPVGLQSYWADESGYVSWVEPDGKIVRKKSANRKVGRKAHGHTLFKGTNWEFNFEKEFGIDDRVHEIVSTLNSFVPFGRKPSEWLYIIGLMFKRDRIPQDAAKIYHMDDETLRAATLFIVSLLLRSPNKRNRFESYSRLTGNEPDENVGKLNMHQAFLLAKKICERSLGNRHMVLLHSPFDRFTCGDGTLDWMTGNGDGGLRGRALIPLTPKLCIYCSTPMIMRKDRNCAAIIAAPWMIERVNYLVQVYSKNHIFFRGKPPKIEDVFRVNAFMQHRNYRDYLTDFLDEIVTGHKPSPQWSAI